MLIRLKQSGDTVIEVLIALAIIGAVLTGAYASSIFSLRDTQRAEERTEALKRAETQVELLKTNPTITSTDPTNPASIFSSAIPDAVDPPDPLDPVPLFCMNNDATVRYLPRPNNGCGLPTGGFTYYTHIVRIETPASSGNYKFTVETYWLGIQGGTDHVILVYKVDK